MRKSLSEIQNNFLTKAEAKEIAVLIKKDMSYIKNLDYYTNGELALILTELGGNTEIPFNCICNSNYKERIYQICSLYNNKFIM